MISKCLKTTAFAVILSFVTLASLPAEMNILPLSKTEQWEQLAADVDTWGDGLGYPLDEGIKETVIVLNLLGFETAQSCEGHQNWGQPFPWVYFKYKDPIYDELAKKYEDIDPLSENYGEEIVKVSEQMDNVIPLQIQEIQPLNDLLDEYYSTAKKEPKWFVLPGANIYFLYPIDFEIAEVRQGEERAAMLEVYRAEMKDLTEFMKNKFYNN